MELPFEYEQIPPITWAYLSSFLLLALFFKFNRFWSVRNFDLLLIILLAPGLLLVKGGQELLWQSEKEASRIVRPLEMQKVPNVEDPASTIEPGQVLPETKQDTPKKESQTNQDLTQVSIQDAVLKAEIDSGESIESEDPKPPTPDEIESAIVQPEVSLNEPGHVWQRWGYYWLFTVGAILLIRMLIDPSLTRRPLLDPNLSIGGLVFFGFSLMVFLFANIATSEPTPGDLDGARNAVKLIQREAAQEGDIDLLRKRGPGYRLFNLLPIIPSFEDGNEMMQTDPESGSMNRYVIAAKSLAIASQLLIVLGLILFCYHNYNSFLVGVGVATIYLMLPYTAMYTGHVLHALPAGLLIWALVSFRRPGIAGVLVGLATGVSYYPIFLIPLWASFYWERGVKRFVSGVLIAIGLCIGGLVFTSVDVVDFGNQLRVMFGFLVPLMDGLEGIWSLGWSHWWRLPLLVTFVLLAVSFVFWPTEKNIGTLVSYTAVVMISVQFWHGFLGGTYIAWYMPMLLLTVFRPNLQGRVALSELNESKRPRKETPEDILPAA